MDNQFGHVVIRMPFESVLDQLRNELTKEGFEISGITDFQNLREATGSSTERYCVLTVYHALLYKEMLTIAPTEGTILPCLISVVETYTGETMIVRFNTTDIEYVGNMHTVLRNLTYEVTKRMEVAIHALEKNHTGDPDLVTSWG